MTANARLPDRSRCSLAGSRRDGFFEPVKSERSCMGHEIFECRKLVRSAGRQRCTIAHRDFEQTGDTLKRRCHFGEQLGSYCGFRSAL
jgi:hypothetical protein